MIRSRVSTAASFAHSADFLSDVDSCRAPGDAASTSNATQAAKLVRPRRQLVGHPLAIAGLPRRANTSPVNVGEALREARVPSSPTFRMSPANVSDVLNRGAEARRTRHRAIRATQAPRCNFVPLRVLEIVVQKIFQPRSIQLAL